jgi:cytochrome P450
MRGSTTDVAALYDFSNPRLFANPHPLYHALRNNDPVCWIEPFQGWAVSSYDTCMTVMTDAEHFRPGPFSWEPFPSYYPAAHGTEPAASASLELITTSLFSINPPEHTRIRSSVSKGFSSQALTTYRDLTERVVAKLLELVQPHSAMDAQKEFADRLPFELTAEFLGIQERDRATIRDWTYALALFGAGLIDDLETMRRLDATLIEFVDYIQRLLSERRHAPGDDMLSYILSEAPNYRISERELCFVVLQLFSAGHINMTNLLGMGTLTFLQHQHQFAHLHMQPQLIHNAIEELLRYVSPQQILNRHVATDIKLHGQNLRQGDKVYVIIAAANRDPAVFSQPDEFDITRANAHRHLASGLGIHYCIGAKLVRIVGEVVFRQLSERLPGLKLAGEPTWRTSSLYFRGLESLPVSW